MVSLTFQEIVELMKMIEAGSCQELVLESEGMKLIIRRGASAGDTSLKAFGAAAGTDAGPDETAGPAARRPTGRDAAPVQTPRSDGMIEVRAPMVGIFYRAPSPDAPPYVELDSKVEPGDPLCVIEVMKLFTTIEASAAGRVVEIVPDNGEPVEYDALLFVIEPL
jgi:acetyl-CoA carboxylase biotin carboxyl carrier protein